MRTTTSSTTYRRLGHDLAAVVVLGGLFLIGVLFIVRAAGRPFISPTTSNAWAKLFFHGGASEIVGTRPPGSTRRDMLLWELTENHVFKVFFLELANRYDQFIGWNVPALHPAGAPFVVGHGYLGRSRYVAAPVRRQIVEMATGAMRAFRNGGIPAVYVVPPTRFSAADEPFDGVFNFENAVQDEIVAALAARDFRCLDTRAEMAAANLEPHAAFFATDHHFTPETGLWVAQAIARHLQRTLGLPLDLTALETNRFRFANRPRCFLGSMGRRTTLARCKPDDFALMDTALPVDFELRIPARRLQARGPFRILLWPERLETANPYQSNPYTAYLWSDNPLVSIRNHSCTNGIRLLFLSDSVDNVVVPPIASAVSEVVTMDFRHNPPDLWAYLAQNRFDAVLLFWHFPEPGYQSRFRR